MKSKPNTPTSTPSTEEDIDIGQLVDKTRGFLAGVADAIWRVLVFIGRGFLYVLLFFKRNLVWLAIGGAVGLSYGWYTQLRNGARYSGQMTVRANFNSGKALYNSLNFFNSLVSAGDFTRLAGILGVSPDEAAGLKYFEARPVESELVTAEMYKSQFLETGRNISFRMDTFWMRTLDYEHFKRSLTKFDFPMHDITVISTNPTIFPKIQDGLLSQVNNNPTLTKIKTSKSETDAQVLQLLSGSLKSIDTLKNVFNRRLLEPASANESGNSISLLNGAVGYQSPELQLYDKLLELKDELKSEKSKAILDNDIVEIYFPFNLVGTKEGIFRQSIIRHGLLGLLAAATIIVLISLYRSLNNIEKSLRLKKAPAGRIEEHP